MSALPHAVLRPLPFYLAPTPNAVDPEAMRLAALWARYRSREGVLCPSCERLPLALVHAEVAFVYRLACAHCGTRTEWFRAHPELPVTVHVGPAPL